MVVILGIAFVFGKTGVIVLFALVSLRRVARVHHVDAHAPRRPLALAVAFFVVLPLQYFLVWIDWYGLYSIFIPVYVFLLLAIIAAARGRTPRIS